MSVSIAPRLDPRLRQFIVGAAFGTSPAEVTRAAGELAWELGLRRPSYQHVRVLMRGGGDGALVRTPRGKTALEQLETIVNLMYEYPAPFMDGFFEGRLRRRT